MPEILYDTQFLQLKSAKSPGGKDWVYAHRPNADNVVIIVPLIINGDKKQILFIRELRPPLYAENRSKYNIGLPAGLVGDERKGESTLDAIKAELLEETGLVADKIEIVAEKISSSSGCTSETSTIAIATISNPVPIQEPVLPADRDTCAYYNPQSSSNDTHPNDWSAISLWAKIPPNWSSESCQISNNS